MAEILILTTPILQADSLIEYRGIVTARNVRAVNMIRDFFTAIRDIFGGRSDSYEDIMATMERELLCDIRAKAQRMGANAIIGFSLDFENIGSKNKSLIMAHGTGTAVVIRIP